MSISTAELLRSFVAAASVEVTPRHAAAVAEVGELLPAGSGVYITMLPGSDPFRLVAAAAEIRQAGHVPVPHLAVRGIEGPDQLERLLGRLVAEAAVDDVLVVGGGVKTPAGAYREAMDVLRSGLLERHGIRRVGVAGHPEGTPDVSPDVITASLDEKNRFAAESPIQLRIVTQFALAAEPYLAWERAIRARGNRLPVIAGLPGVTSPATLVKYGLACGIGPSLEVLRKQSGGLLRLATTRHWKPDAIAAEIAGSVAADRDSLIRGFHMFPFGGLDRTAQWLREAGTPQALPA